jgi:hypothetical protein
MKCKIVARPDATTLARIQREQERKQRQQALRDARRPGANLTFTIFDKLNAKGGK